MSYLVLARKWRPQRFDEVVGQSHVTKTLANAIEMDRVAHSFIFSGVRGVGKTSLARILAKSLNCAKGPTLEPCGECQSCKAVTAGTSIDVIEIDGASNNSVEDIRELRETVPYRPVLGQYKIYVIDEVHMLSVSAFNALLKTLEEPPPHVKFIFATTEPHKIPVTILSRCQRYDFRRIPTAAIVERIRTILNAEQIGADEKALSIIGQEAQGSMRDALSILDQVLAAGASDITAQIVADLLGVVEGRVFLDLSKAILDSDPRTCIEIVRHVDHDGYDIPTFSKGLLEHLGNLVVAGVCKGDKSVLDLPDDEIEELFKQASSVSTNTLHRIFKHFSESYETIARSFHPRIMLETSLARIADLGELVPAADLVKRLEALASQPRGPAPSAASPSRPPQSSGPSGGPGTPPPSRTPRHTQSSGPIASEQSAPLTKPEEKAPAPPIPASSPPAPVADAELDLQGALNALKRKTPSLASILDYGVPTIDNANRILRFGFAEEYSGVAALANDRRAEISKNLEKRIGHPVRIEVSVDNSVEVPNVTRERIEKEELTRQREEEARQHPLVRQAQSQLGGTITNVRLIREPDA